MTDTFSKLREELSVQYPGFTDIELTEMTSNLIDFYTEAVKVVLKNQEDSQEIKKLVVDDYNFLDQPD